MQEKKTFFPMSRKFATKRNSLDNPLLLREPSSFSENSSHHAGPETARSCFYRRRSPPFCSPHTSCLGPGCMCPELPGRAGCVSSLPSLSTLLTWHEGAPDKFSFPFQLGCLHQMLEIRFCPHISKSQLRRTSWAPHKSKQEGLLS